MGSFRMGDRVRLLSSDNPWEIEGSVISVEGPYIEDFVMQDKCSRHNWTVGVRDSSGEVYWGAENEIVLVYRSKPEKFSSPEECEEWLNSHLGIG